MGALIDLINGDDDDDEEEEVFTPSPVTLESAASLEVDASAKTADDFEGMAEGIPAPCNIDGGPWASLKPSRASGDAPTFAMLSSVEPNVCSTSWGTDDGTPLLAKYDVNVATRGLSVYKAGLFGGMCNDDLYGSSNNLTAAKRNGCAPQNARKIVGAEVDIADTFCQVSFETTAGVESRSFKNIDTMECDEGGSTTTCEDMATKSICKTNTQCYWNEPKQCNILSDKKECKAVNGCSWKKDTCKGTPIAACETVQCGSLLSEADGSKTDKQKIKQCNANKSKGFPNCRYEGNEKNSKTAGSCWDPSDKEAKKCANFVSESACDAQFSVEGCGWAGEDLGCVDSRTFKKCEDVTNGKSCEALINCRKGEDNKCRQRDDAVTCKEFNKMGREVCDNSVEPACGWSGLKCKPLADLTECAGFDATGCNDAIIADIAGACAWDGKACVPDDPECTATEEDHCNNSSNCSWVEQGSKKEGNSWVTEDPACMVKEQINCADVSVDTCLSHSQCWLADSDRYKISKDPGDTKKCVASESVNACAVQSHDLCGKKQGDRDPPGPTCIWTRDPSTEIGKCESVVNTSCYGYEASECESAPSCVYDILAEERNAGGNVTKSGCMPNSTELNYVWTGFKVISSANEKAGSTCGAGWETLFSEDQRQFKDYDGNHPAEIAAEVVAAGYTLGLSSIMKRSPIGRALGFAGGGKSTPWHMHADNTGGDTHEDGGPPGTKYQHLCIRRGLARDSANMELAITHIKTDKAPDKIDPDLTWEDAGYIGTHHDKREKIHVYIKSRASMRKGAMSTAEIDKIMPLINPVADFKHARTDEPYMFEKSDGGDASKCAYNGTGSNSSELKNPANPSDGDQARLVALGRVSAFGGDSYYDRCGKDENDNIDYTIKSHGGRPLGRQLNIMCNNKYGNGLNICTLPAK